MRVRNCTLGEGRPKICVPITATEEEEALNQASVLAEKANVCLDLTELRIDYFTYLRDSAKLIGTLGKIREVLGDIPLLCTLRTSAEGGEAKVTPEEYEELLNLCLDSGKIDLLDVELSCGDSSMERIRKKAKECGVFVLASSHDFNQTPSVEEMVEKLIRMEEMGADIAKIAVMPQKEEDVLALLQASLQAKRTLNIPFIAISMGRMGMLSRIAGETFGSCMTFASINHTSAPGQLEAGKIWNILETM